MKTYKNNYQLQEIISEKLVGVDNWPEYSFVDGIFKYKGRIVIGKEWCIKENVVKICRDCIEDYDRTKNSYKRFKVVFY